MVDREAVIRELTQHIARADSIETDWMDCVSVPMLRGALELLKEPYRFGKWKRIPAGMTPGGMPMYACAECGGTEHLHGVEYPQRYVICERCGSINTYPWEVTIDEYRETGRKCR